MRLIAFFSVAAGLIYLPFSGYLPNFLGTKKAENPVNTRFTNKVDNVALQRLQRLQTAWADSVYNVLTDDERVGQTLMLRAHSDKGADYEAQVQAQIEQLHAGGVCFFQGTASQQANLTNRYQRVARLPLLVAIDGEWGLSMRLKNTMVFPRQMTLGALQDNSLIYEMGAEIARQCKRTGINVNFAPVVDCNTNPRNPVIGDRSFGEDKTVVAAKGWSYASGMQDNGVMACAKHFPGHGDADVDSHFDLPKINASIERLNEIEMVPFQLLKQQGIMSMMVAHLSIPSLDATPNQPSSLSRKIITDLLRNSWGFEGLLFTDGMEMQGVTKYYPSGKADAQAMIAGNDIDLLPQNPTLAFNAIKAALADGSLSRAEFETKIKRILAAKYRLGLRYKPADIDLGNMDSDLNRPEAEALRRRLYQGALTLARNEQNTVPIQDVGAKRIASVAIGAGAQNTFQRTLGEYGAVSNYVSPKEVAANILPALKGKDVVIVSLHGLSRKASEGFGVSQSTINFINKLSQQTKVVVCVFGSPYALRGLDSAACVVAAYEDNKTTQELAAQGIFGAIPMSGRLPVTASAKSKAGDGVGFKSLNLLRTAVAEEVGLSSDTLKGIDDIGNELVSNGTAPGCQIMVVKDGAIVYHHTFGFWDYKRTRATDSSDLYDMASVTKIMATTTSLMTLYDQQKFDVEKTMGDYLPELKRTNKAKLSIKKVMSHQAGLTAWVPFYKQTIDAKGNWLSGNYNKNNDGEYNIQVADAMYANEAWREKIWQQIYATPVEPKPVYKYSDLGFYLFAKMIKQISGEPIDVYTQKHLYEPLGMAHTTFLPLQKFDVSQIVPSENDTYWRHQVLQGHVHDMGAAMLGGVSGHAGLFSNAHDVATLFQMFLNGGEYGGRRYINESTLKLFTTRVQGSSRRSLGFDMKDLASTKVENVSLCASKNCFGHTGFVGQGVWADPDQKLLFIFLSNRTFPTMDNNKLNTLQYRAKIQDLIYKAIRKK